MYPLVQLKTTIELRVFACGIAPGCVCGITRRFGMFIGVLSTTILARALASLQVLGVEGFELFNSASRPSSIFVSSEANISALHHHKIIKMHTLFRVLRLHLFKLQPRHVDDLVCEQCTEEDLDEWHAP